MIRKFTLSAIAVLGLAGGAFAAGGEKEVKDYDFSFEGPFGVYDQDQLQRGLQVYTEVCAACHGLRYVPLRTLGDEGGPHLPADQVRAYAEQNFEVFDAELDDFRPAKPVDHFPANDAVGAPDLSLMAKARAGFSGPYGSGMNQLFKGMGGAEYIASFLTGYTGKEADGGLYENKAFGGYVSMAPPLSAGLVEYQDGTESSEEQMAKDVSAFLMWTAEPKLNDRKFAGFKWVTFLIVISVLLYLTNKTLWAGVKGKNKGDAA